MSFLKPMKLKGFVEMNDDQSMTFFGKLYDDQEFNLRVGQWDIQLNEEFRPSRRRVEGFLFVQQEGQRGDSVYLTLPKPTINHGKQVTVKAINLMPREASINDFNPEKKTAKKTVSKKSDE